MFGSDVNKYPDQDKKRLSKEDDDLESYLRMRNEAIGEETKSLAELAEEKAMDEYMRLRAKAYGDSVETTQKPDGKESKGTEDDDIDTYLEQRSKTLGEELTKQEREDQELEAYMRERKQIMDD